MVELEALLKGFACPVVPMSSEVIESIVCEYTRGYAQLFLDRFRSELERSTDGIVSFLQTWLEADIRFDTAWDPTLGTFRRALVAEGVDPVSGAVLAALQLCSQGVSGAWQARVREPMRARWASLLFPRATEIAVTGGRDEFAVKLRDPLGSHWDLMLHRAGGIWQSTPCGELAHVLMDKHQVYILAGAALDHVAPRRNPFELSHSSSNDIVVTFREAIDVLRRHAPAYLQWVDRVIREVLPLNGADGVLRSSSSKEWPGAIDVSFPGPPIAVAEMLVHEACHQYFYIVTRVSALHDGSDTRLYHSPVKGEGRPIEAILLAFHAFANVVAFYRSCLENGVQDGGYCERNVKRHLPELEVLREHLRSSKALTKTGTVLCEDLAAHVGL